MRLNWLILGGAALALLAFWLWPEATGRSTRAVTLSDGGAAETRAEALEPAVSVPDATEERAAVDTPVSEPAVFVDATAEGERQVRIRFLDAQTEEPLVGYPLDLLPRFSRTAERIPGITDEAGEFEANMAPGEYLPLQQRIAGAPRRVARQIAPEVFEVPADGFDVPFIVTLHGRVPPRLLEVEVVRQDGSAAAGAWALFDCRTDNQPFVEARGRTDEQGRAWLGVWDPEGFTAGIVRAWDDEGNVSELQPVESPVVPGVRRLVLAPGARIEVSLRDAEDRPIPGRRVLIASQLEVGPRIYRETDAAGRYAFTGIFPGTYDVGAWRAAGSAYTYETVEVRHGETRSVEIQLEEGERLAAVRGRVVDEQGAPVAGAILVVTPEGAWDQEVRSDAKGEFAFHGDECESLLIRANLSSEGDAFAPDSARVPYGTHDVLFTRMRQAVTRSFEVEVVDAVTGAEVEHFVATIDRGPGTEEWGNSYAPRRAFELRVLPDSRWRVGSHGYLVRELELEQELERLADGERLRVGLEPGLDHAFVVQDANTLAPIEGVLFRSETAGEVRSDARGNVRIRAAEWSVYRVSVPGYEPEEWDPDDYVLWAWGPLNLVPEESATAD